MAIGRKAFGHTEGGIARVGSDLKHAARTQNFANQTQEATLLVPATHAGHEYLLPGFALDPLE
jgi:hypothetical protein